MNQQAQLLTLGGHQGAKHRHVGQRCAVSHPLQEECDMTILAVQHEVHDFNEHGSGPSGRNKASPLQLCIEVTLLRRLDMATLTRQLAPVVSEIQRRA
jgi:hypothetical protein